MGMGMGRNNNFAGGPNAPQQGGFDQPGYNTGVGAGGAAQPTMAPQTGARPSGESKFAGRAEAALGELLGSNSLKQRGAEKQQ